MWLCVIFYDVSHCHSNVLKGSRAASGTDESVPLAQTQKTPGGVLENGSKKLFLVLQIEFNRALWEKRGKPHVRTIKFQKNGKC